MQVISAASEAYEKSRLSLEFIEIEMSSITVNCFAKALFMHVLSKFICTASLLTVPRSSVAVIGDRVELKCSVDGNQSVVWGFTSFNTSKDTDIYFGDDISSPFKSRYKIDKNFRGQHNLIIDSIDLDHAGRYQCVTIVTGHKSVALLTVLESSPECSASINNTDKETWENSYLWMWCRITSTGNMIPVFNWTKDNTDDIIATNTTSISGHSGIILMTTTSSVIRQLHFEDYGVDFSCSITFQLPNNSQENTPNYEYTWRYNLSATFNDPHGPRNLSIVRNGDRLECSADGNPTPIYRWTHVETNAVTKGHILKLNRTYDKATTFQCTASNPMANANKSLTIEGSSSGSDSSQRTIVAAAFGGISFLLLLIIIIVSCLINRKKHKGLTRTPASIFGQTVIDEPDIIDVDIYSFDGVLFNRRPTTEQNGSDAFGQFENYRAVTEDFPVYADVQKRKESLINNSNCASSNHGDDNFPSPQGSIQKKKRQNRVGADGTVYVDLSEVKQPFKISTSRAAALHDLCDSNYAFIDHTARIPPPPPPPPEF